MFGERRKRLMRHLLRNKAGAGIDELARAIGVTRTAVRQHLAALLQEGRVGAGGERATGGRPQRLFVLTKEGREAFPRHYSWFAQLRQRWPEKASRRERVGNVSSLMDELG